jgi:thiol-disulfide isomerase/thioredoxin/uncharacterized membrane protein YidH (DUF202 family)
MLMLMIFAISSLALVSVSAQKPIFAYYFYNESCTHCQEESLFLNSLESEYADFHVYRYDVVSSGEASDLFDSVREAFDKKTVLTPFLVIGGTAFVGFSDQIETDIRTTLSRYQTEEFVDVVAKVIANEPIDPTDIEFIRFSPGDYVNLPLLGPVAIDSLSLFLAAIVLGFVDGFNPCAMWILVFLIALLIDLKNRSRMWVLGLVFLLTSSFVYFLIMSAWLQIGFSVAGIVWVRILIGLFAFGFGLFNLIRFFMQRKDPIGCAPKDANKRRIVQEKIRKLLTGKTLIMAMGGIMALAISVNLLELSCSAGLPLLYTQILAYNDLPVSLYYLYILVYVFVFMLDDILVFSGAMITLRITGFSAKYTRYSHFIGGLIMILIGFLLIFFPNILFFS